MKPGMGIIQSVLSDPHDRAVLFGACITLAGSLLVAVVNGLMKWGKFRRDQLWEKRQTACNEVVSRLRASSKFADAIREGFSEDVRSFYGSDRLERLSDEYGVETNAAHQAFLANYLILPPAFRKRYEQLDQERGLAWYYSGGPDIYLDPIAANERARRDLFDLARAELGIVPWWKRWALRCRLAIIFLRDGAQKRWRRLCRAWRRRRVGEREEW